MFAPSKLHRMIYEYSEVLIESVNHLLKYQVEELENELYGRLNTTQEEEEERYKRWLRRNNLKKRRSSR
jgi:hypothetical protein